MRYRTLGNSDVEVSEVGFGVWTVSAGWWGQYTDDEAVRLLRQALDLGITFFDTADTYGSGRGETLLAQAFRGRRHEIVVGTKFGYDFYHHDSPQRGQRELPQDFSPQFMRFALEQSLRRLETDYVDVYQLHNPRMPAILRDDLFAELEKLRDEGKIRAYGAALGPAIGGTEHGDQAMEARPMHALQIIYNLLEQDPGRRFFPIAREKRVGVLVRVPHSSGLLEGKYTAETTFPPNDHRSHRPREWLVDGLKKLERLTFLTEGTGRTIGQAAIQFILAEPSVASVLPNIYNSEQLVEFASAPDTPALTAEELARIADLYDHNFYLDAEPSAV
ncbi:MAG TPA: aldo/keto reductase [Chloroflexota bacterium]